MLRGIDISTWQGDIDWPKAAPHFDFVFMRSTHGDAPGLAVDNRYARNIAGARAQRKLRGTYHFPGAHDPATEAQYYVKHTLRRDGELQFLDFEGPVLTHIQKAFRVPWALKFLDTTYAETGNRPLIYMSESVLLDHDWSPVVHRNYGLIVAKWSSRTPSHGQWPFWVVWQDSDHYPVPGIPSAPDSDWFNGDATVWAKYGAGSFTSPVGSPSTAPTPPPVKVPPKSPWPQEYTTQKDDTLWGIAVHFYKDGTKYPLIAKANHIANPNVIGQGVKLIIPDPKN